MEIPPKQQQYIETIFNHGQQIKINKKFDGLDLDRFDLELPGNFMEKFPGSVQVKKNSASPTNIWKTTINGKEYFVKSFTIPDTYSRRFGKEDPSSALLYEKEVYRYIRSKAVRNKEIRQNIIQMVLSARDQKNRKAYIFTEDRGGVPLYLIKGTKNALAYYFKDMSHKITAEFVTNIFTQFLYIISLMYSISVVHNDLHLGNVLLVKDNIDTKEYNIFGKTFVIKNHPYSLVVYDFDIGSIVNPPEWRNRFREDTCKEYGRCKDYISTDLYLWMVHILEPSWAFVNIMEKQKYIAVVDKFQQMLQPMDKKGFFDKLFSKQSAQSRVFRAIKKKFETFYNYYSNKQEYPSPIFHASCKKYYFSSYHIPAECAELFEEVDGRKIATAWYDAVTTAVF